MAALDRRNFIKLTMVSAAAVTCGCGTQGARDEATGRYGGTANKIIPYVDQPEGLQDGIPQWFATTCRMCTAGCGLVVRTFGGRAVKVEGNPEHPVNRGKTCARGQASLQHLYNPDRLRYPMQRNAQARLVRTDWETALQTVATQLRSHHGHVAFLVDSVAYGQSPATLEMLQRISQSVGGTVYEYALLDDAPWRAAAQAVYGQPALPCYALDQADVLAAFNANILEAWPSPVLYGRLYGEFRQGRRANARQPKFVYVGPRMSMTAANADQWLPCRAGTEGAVADAILGILRGSGGTPAADAARISGLSEQQITGLASEFQAAGPRALALAGDGLVSQPNATETITTVELLNAQVRSAGVRPGSAARQTPPTRSASFAQMQKLVAAIHGGTVTAVITLGQVNPAFIVPAATGFADAMGRVPFTVALSSFADAADGAQIALPAATFLEEWSDAIPAVIPNGTKMASLLQPVADTSTIEATEHSREPWMLPRPVNDILADLLHRIGAAPGGTSGKAQLQAAWAGMGNWDAIAERGGYWSESTPTASPQHPGAAATVPTARLQNAAPPAGSFQMVLYPHLYWTDGRHARLPWLQEIPDPMSMAVWNNWIEINNTVAHKMGIRTGDLIRVDTGSGTIELPALPTPGIHPEAVAIPIGQVFAGAKHYAAGNPLQILPEQTDRATGALAYGLTTVRITKVRDAKSGYNAAENTLVLMQDRPGGEEPEAVKALIHATAKEHKQRSDTSNG